MAREYKQPVDKVLGKFADVKTREMFAEATMALAPKKAKTKAKAKKADKKPKAKKKKK
jgi:hypothetical protein